MKVIQGIYPGVTTSELDNLAAETAASLTTTHPDYALLASRIAVSNLHKNTEKSFSKTMELLYTYLDPKTGAKASLVADDVFEIIKANAQLLDSSIIYDRDFGYDYFGFKTLERSYLLKIDGKVAERPQHMLMRIGRHPQRRRGICDRNLQPHERALVHACNASALQRRHAETADVLLLPAPGERRQHRRHLRHAEELR
jgi:hypothetical protein